MSSSSSSTGPADAGSAKIVHDYDLYREGDFEPHLGKTIKILIFKTTKFIVYLDEDLFVEWAFTPAFQTHWTPEVSRVLNRVTQVQAFPLSHLTTEQLTTFRQMVGEAVARLLKDLKAGPANEALDAAVRWVRGRNREIARAWYLMASVVTTSVVAALAVIAWLLRQQIRPVIGDTAFDVVLGALAGGIGALLFILGRSRHIHFDPTASKPIHQFEGAARVVTGGIGALLVALAIKGGILFSTLSISGSRLAGLLTLCMVAGASERLVPSFIEKVERHAEKEEMPESDDKDDTSK